MPPRILNPDRDSIPTLLDEVIYTVSRLRLSKAAAALLPRWEALLKEVSAAAEKERGLVAKIAEALAGVEYVDSEKLDVVVGDVINTLLKLVNQDRGHSVYQHYLRGVAPSELTRPVLAAQVEHTRAWPTSLKAAPEKELQDLATPIADAVAAADQATKVLTDAQAELGDFRARVRPALFERLNADRQTLFGELLKLEESDKTGRLGKDYARRFFRVRSSRSEPAETLAVLAEEETTLLAQLQAVKDRKAALQARTEAERLAAEQRRQDEAALAEAQRRAAEAQAEIARIKKKLDG